MSDASRFTFWAVAPFAAWMALMFILPSTPTAYAARTAVSLALLIGSARVFWQRSGILSALGFGIAIGMLVLFIWVWPERFEWYRHLCIIGEGGTAAIDESPFAMKAIRLFGSAFVIAPAEELFFRSFLYRWLQRRDWTKVPLANFDLTAFLWMIGLFALEHDRIVVGAIAGALYGFLAIGKGLGAAIIAHVVTNLALGIYVLFTDNWAFW